MKEVIIVRGCQGSGKSTFANLLTAGRPNSVIIEADEFMHNEDGIYDFQYSKLSECHKRAFDKFKDSLESNMAYIVVSNVGQRWKHCEEYFNLAKEYGYKVTSLILENRNDTQNIHDVPLDKVQNIANNFEIKLV